MTPGLRVVSRKDRSVQAAVNNGCLCDFYVSVHTHRRPRGHGVYIGMRGAGQQDLMAGITASI